MGTTANEFFSLWRKNPIMGEIKEKILLAFDFDDTLINANSDLYVIKLAPGGTLPDHIEALYSSNGWNKYMGEIFKYLHTTGTTRQQVLQCMSEISLTDGMQQLLDFTSADPVFEHVI